MYENVFMYAKVSINISIEIFHMEEHSSELIKSCHSKMKCIMNGGTEVGMETEQNIIKSVITSNIG